MPCLKKDEPGLRRALGVVNKRVTAWAVMVAALRDDEDRGEVSGDKVWMARAAWEEAKVTQAALRELLGTANLHGEADGG